MTDAAPTLGVDEWISRFAAALGVEAPDRATVDALLDLAGDAAHASARQAAPIACFLVGAAGMDVTEARRVATTIAAAG